MPRTPDREANRPEAGKGTCSMDEFVTWQGALSVSGAAAMVYFVNMALRKASEKIRGELSNEVKWALDDIAKGKERVEALKELGERTGVDDVDSFITAIIQAEQLGSNIANMLRVQSNTMRIKRRQRAEEAAAKLPIKLIFPLVFFLIPAIFIVILAPAVLNAAESLKMLF